MTYSKLISAVPALQKLVGQDLPLTVAYNLSKLVKSVNEELDFFRSQSASIYAKHEIPNSPACAAEIDELLGMELEWNAAPVSIGMDENIKLSCSDLDALEELITFIEN